MVYCSNCGEKIADDSLFCPKCGTRTPKGKAAHATYPSDELWAAFAAVGTEMERAFTLAARETHAAFKKASENMAQKTGVKPPTTAAACPKCGTKNPAGSVFCNNCGTKLAADEPKGST